MRGLRPGVLTRPIFTVRPAPVAGAIAICGRAYAGFPFLGTVTTGATLSGGTVTLERRAGSRWRTLDTASFDTDGTQLFATLPAGRHEVRARVGALVVARRVVPVLRPGRRGTSARDDGAYGPASSAPAAALRMRVAGGGTRLTGFRASVALLCPSGRVGEDRFVVRFATLGSARIDPGGRVAARVTTAGGTRVRLTGRLAARRFTGSVTMVLGTCSGTRAVVAVRR